MGKMDQTNSGTKCIKWINQVDKDFFDGSMTNANNYCRNPKVSKLKPWCYTGYNLEMGHCDIRPCKYGKFPNIYTFTHTLK